MKPCYIIFNEKIFYKITTAICAPELVTLAVAFTCVMYGRPTLSLTQMPVVKYQDQPLTSGPALKFQDQPERDQDQPEWVTGVICVGVTPRR